MPNPSLISSCRAPWRSSTLFRSRRASSTRHSLHAWWHGLFRHLPDPLSTASYRASARSCVYQRDLCASRTPHIIIIWLAFFVTLLPISAPADGRASRSTAKAALQLEQRQKRPVFRVWATDDGEKISPDALVPPPKQRSLLWNGKRIELFAARNEIVAFQVIVRSGPLGVRRLRAALPALRHRGSGRSIRYRPPTVDPTQYYRRPIQLFSVNYMEVNAPTTASWISLPSQRSAPTGFTGWQAVQLIPENAQRGRGGFPLRVAPRWNQSIWTEIYVGRDLPAGVYRGAVRLRGDGYTRRVPVQLRVLDFTLPDENRMNAMLFFEPEQIALYHGADRSLAYHRLAHRHRVELVHGYDPHLLRRATGRFNGTDFSPSNGYEGPGREIGNRFIPASFYGPGAAYDQRTTAWSSADAWMTLLRAQFPNATTFLYLPDEPSPIQFPEIRSLVEHLRANPGIGRTLPTLITSGFTPALATVVDIWVTSPAAFSAADMRRAQRLGGKYWMYNGGRPYTGTVLIDAPATDARAIIWSCFKKGVETYFYWHSVHWQHNHQKVGERVQNVWRNSVTFDNRGQPHKPLSGQGFANGDGVLLYPGEEILHPEEHRAIQGPIATIQLANLRRGLQDHLYLSIAREFGLEREVQEALRFVVPHVLDEAADQLGFAQRSEPFETARIALGRAIEEASARRRLTSPRE